MRYQPQTAICSGTPNAPVYRALDELKHHWVHQRVVGWVTDPAPRVTAQVRSIP